MEGWKSTGTSTKILWGAAIQALLLTLATWAIAIPMGKTEVLQYLGGIVMLIGAPAGLAIAQYQLSKFQNQKHVRLNGAAAQTGPAPPTPPQPPEVPK